VILLGLLNGFVYVSVAFFSEVNFKDGIANQIAKQTVIFSILPHVIITTTVTYTIAIGLPNMEFSMQVSCVYDTMTTASSKIRVHNH